MGKGDDDGRSESERRRRERDERSEKSRCRRRQRDENTNGAARGAVGPSLLTTAPDATRTPLHFPSPSHLDRTPTKDWLPSLLLACTVLVVV